MDRNEFFQAVRRYEIALGKTANWTLVALVALLVAPMALLLLPRERMPPMSAIVIAWIAALAGYLMFQRWLNRRTAVAMGMTCSKCGATLSLHNLGFSNACQECGAQVFTETNSAADRHHGRLIEVVRRHGDPVRRRLLILTTILLVSSAVCAQNAVQGSYSTEPLRAPIFDVASVTVETVAINNWLNANYEHLSPDQMKGPREHLYYLIDSRVKDTYARTGKVLPGEHDAILERLFSWAERLGVYGGSLVYNRLRTPSEPALSSTLQPPAGFSIELTGDLLTVRSKTGRWSVNFPYYFMLWNVSDFEAKNGFRTQLIALSTGAAKDKSQEGHSQATLLLIFSPAASSERFEASWKEQLGIPANAETKDVSIKGRRAYYRFDTQSKMHTEFVSWQERQGPFAVAYIGLDGTYQWNRPHFVDFVRRVRVE